MHITVSTYTFYSIERLTRKEFELLSRALRLFRATHPDDPLLMREIREIREKFESVEEYNETLPEAKGDLET